MNLAGTSLRQRVAILTWTLPPGLGLLAVFYQVFLAYWTNGAASVPVREGAELLFYVLVFPLLVFWSLKRIGRWLDQIEQPGMQNQSIEGRLAWIMTTAADAIIGTDAQGRIETWNFGAELLFGYATLDIKGRPLSVLLGEGAVARTEVRWLLETTRREGFVSRHETTCRDGLGRELIVELTATILNDGQRDSSGISIIMRDITKRKHRDEETQRLNAQLNQQALGKAHELAEKVEQLAQANTELRQLDQMRSEFVALVSHQIRAPLTNMVGAVDRMQFDCQAVNSTCSRMFAIFQQQVARLDRLVQDTLTAARIESGQMFLHMEPISVLAVVRQAIQQISARTSPHAIHLADKPGLPLVYADRDRVAEVLANLLDNADKYATSEQGVSIEVRADQTEVTIAVRDSGPGLPANDFERIFDKFYRTDSSDSQAAYGYGLGLYVCRRLVEAQNGRIWAENHPDGGAVFSFSLPVYEG